MAKGKREIEKDEFGNDIIVNESAQTPPQFRNPDSVMSLKNKQGKAMPSMTLAEYLKPHNLKQLPQAMQDRLTGKTPMKTASQLIAEIAFEK
jgi:hypothetical protein